jgi:hypoxanthine phosphoribosyltransferase
MGATTDNRNDLNIAKDALVEFFLPLTQFVKFLKYGSLSNLLNEELLTRLSQVEVNTEIQMSHYKDICIQIESAIFSQKAMLKSINEELVNTRQLISRQHINSSALEDLSYSVTSPIANLVNKTWGLETRELTHGGELSHTAAEIGMAYIEFLLKRITATQKATPHLFGMNKGGAFLANYLAHRMNLDQKYLVKFDITKFEKIMCENREVNGPIVIIDDVTRTGSTLKSAKEYLKNKYPKSKVYTFVLVSVRSEVDENTSALVDYAPWFTKSSKVTLPWSKNRTDDAILTEEYFSDLEMDQIAGRLE